MKVSLSNNVLLSAQFKINEYTSEFGSFITDESKGGNISDTYFLRYNKSELDSSSERSSFIDFYIGKRSLTIQHIDFVSLASFKVIEVSEFSYPNDKTFFSPKIDVSTWVSRFGNVSKFTYDSSKYFYTQIEIDVIIKHDKSHTVEFLFGDPENYYRINDSVCFSIDKFDNLTSFQFSNKIEVPKLLEKLLNK